MAEKSLPAAFYQAECHLLLGDYDHALELYDKVIKRKALRWNRTFQMIASTRMAEIHGERREYEEAAEYMAFSRHFYHNEYLVDWVLEGREKYYKRLSNGKESVTPSVLSTQR